MWHRTVKTTVKKENIDVLIYFDIDESDDGQIVFRSMLNEYFLIFEIKCDDRDVAYNLIKYFPIKVIKEKMLDLAFQNGAIE